MGRANAKVSFIAARRFLLLATLSSFAALLAATASIPPVWAKLSDLSASRWVATWSAAPLADGTTLTVPSRSFADQTVRQLVRVSVGGSRVRVQLSNEYGVRPLVITAAHVALAAAGASIVPESDRTLTFDGESSVSIPEGESRLSDPVALRISSLADLAVSIYVPEDTGPATYHAFGNQTAFISGPGDFSAAVDFPTAATSTARYWLTFVEVLPARRVGALVAIGDSITDGGESTLDANHRWTDFLSVLLAFEQLQAEGYIVPRRGSGNFVASELPDRLPATDGTGPALARQHPLLSERGRALAQARTSDRRSSASPRAFRLGTPAVDVFPFELWAQIARECLRSASSARLDYARLAGLAELREAIAEQMGPRGTSCEPEQVFIVAGAQRGLDLLFHLLLDPGDAACIEDPGYPGAYGALLSAGARAVCVPVDGEGMCIDPAAREQADIRLAYVTPSHQFPLGVPMSLARRRTLLAWASASRAWIVEDDYDCVFRYHAQPLPCLHALASDGRVIYVGTFSKTLFPALRIGFLVVPGDLVDGFSRARLASDVHAPVLEQSILATFMLRGHYQRHLRRMQAVYAERLDALQSAVQRTGAALCLRPVHSGLHAVADLEASDAEQVVREAAARNLETMPLSAYHYAPGQPPNALVLGFGAVRPIAIRAGVSQLAAAIEAAGR